MQNWLPSEQCTLKFMFDGERLEETATADDLDLEDDEVIDVVYA